ncbi:hypothetical protein O1611_g787 [Lasiodiplodia mahajangana]|uniref:Uncharacterized protein n=1 Tax=Lasiodiplodia mahajangana TaxID=1108764 RepID=A0ACC2JZJ5_9PEZI|nr:hypothetical protein O1611_g787 [Lasiodiplodia mahajangana]
MSGHSTAKRDFENAIGYAEDEHDGLSTKRSYRHLGTIHRPSLHSSPSSPNSANTPRLPEIPQSFRVGDKYPVPTGPKPDNICFGMLKDVQIRFNYGRDTYSSALDKLSGNSDNFTILQIEMSEDRCDVVTNGIPVATIATKIHFALTSLPSAAVLSYNGSALQAELRQKLAAAAKFPRAHDTKVPGKIGFTIFGPSSKKNEVAKELARYRLFLQHPNIPMPEGIIYENPQYLGIVASTFRNGAILPPISIDTFQEGPSSVSHSDSDEPTSIAAVLDNLPQHDYLSDARIDKNITTTLLDHQKEAVNFLRNRESAEKQGKLLWKPQISDSGEPRYKHIITGSFSQNPHDMLGGILGDGMGLGKTLSMIACIVSSLAQPQAFVNNASIEDMHEAASPYPVDSTLVIVPSVLLLDGWVDEVERHVAPGTLSLYKYHGPNRKLPSSPPLPYQIVLSTYATVAADYSRGGGVLACFHWRRLILDEAHVIRNWSTKQFKAMKDLSASIRWCVTGTPVQNSLKDLASLITFLRVPLLENATTFRKHIEGGNMNTSKTNFRNLRHLLESICLRRCASSILSLGVSFTEHRPELSDDERKRYNELSILCDKYIKAAVNAKATEAGHNEILTAVLKLRMFCNLGLVGLVQSLVNAGEDGDQLMPDEALSLLQQSGEALCATCEIEVLSSDAHIKFGKQPRSTHRRLKCQDCAQLSYKTRNETAPLGSLGIPQPPIQGDLMEDIQFENNSTSTLTDRALPQTSYPSKIIALVEDIRRHSNEGKSIVFSFWRRSLDLVEKALVEKGVVFARVDGSIHTSRRKEVLVAFQENPSIQVLLMTIGTGAVGLNNLSVANRVHILEPQWNPSVEDQAIGRVARLGQTQKVTVIRYIVRNTIEESIESRQLQKLQLALKSGLKSSNQDRPDGQSRIEHLQALGKIIESGIRAPEDETPLLELYEFPPRSYETKMGKLNPSRMPPFSKANAPQSSTRVLFPHAFQQDSELLDPRQNVRAFLKSDLKPTRLNKIHRHLWLAGLPRPARFLHRQRLLMRTIVLTESPDEHLVWHDTVIWIKPIPEYLLSFEFWEKEICSDEALYESAYGLLLSYTWLISYKSDYRIAVEAGLLPADIDYKTWTTFAINLTMRKTPSISCPINQRYEYGELRLSRLNHLYRLGAAGFSMWNLVAGFTPISTRYPAFFQRNFGWVLAVFVYFTVLLSAVQVALATNLANDGDFQSLSRGIVFLSLAFVLATVVIILLVWSFLFWFHMISTIGYLKRVKLLRKGIIGNNTV